MWKDFRFFRDDKKSMWSNCYKDFIVYDCLDYKLITNILHEPRTQGQNNNKNEIILPNNQGAVVHLQFVNWNNFKLKQAWWMCQEIARTEEKTSYINRKYFYTYFENFPKLKKIKKSWLRHIPKHYFNNLNIDTSLYWKQRFRLFFKTNTIKKFEQLNIWHNIILNDLFFEIEGRRPSLTLTSKLNIFLFFILENFRLIKKYMTNSLVLKGS
jgi:hypothetical protein